MATEGITPRRVLVAASSSKHSREGLIWTLDKLIRSPDDILVVLHVLKPVQYVATSEGYKDVSQVEKEVVQKIDSEARKMGAELLESFENMCAPRKIAPLTKLVEGDRRKVILEECERLGATNLVIGSGGRRLLKMKSTSLTDYCLKHALCAVSVIRKGSVIQSSAAKPGLAKAVQREMPKGLVPSKVEDSFPAPQQVTSLPRPLEVPALSESDRARWRSSAEEAPGGESKPEGGAENGREIAPGESDTSSDFLTRYINKARAEELTRALAQLASEGALDSSTSIGEVSERGSTGRRELAPEQKPVSKPETVAVQVGKDSLPVEGADAEAEESSSNGKAADKVEDVHVSNGVHVSPIHMESGADAEGGGPSRPEEELSAPEGKTVGSKESDVEQEAVASNNAGQADVAAAEATTANQHIEAAVEATAANEHADDADVALAEAVTVSKDAEVAAPEAPTTSGPLSLVADKEVDPNSLSINEVGAEEPQTVVKTEFDSEASVRDREDSFGVFKSHSSIDQELLQMMTLSKKEYVEKSGEVNGFIQYKRPEAPGFTRGLEVLEVLDRWLQEQRSRGQLEEDTCSLESETPDIQASLQGKKGSRIGRLFKAKSKKGERAASPGETAGASAMTGGTTHSALESSSTPPATAGRAEADEQDSNEERIAVPLDISSGLLVRISDVLVADEEGKDDLRAAEDPHQVALPSPNRTVGNDPGEEIDRKRTAANLQSLLEEDNEDPPELKPSPVAEGLPPKGGVKVKVQLLNMEARAAEQSISPRPAGVSKRVSRALLEGMVPELPREDPQDSVTRPSDEPPKQEPVLDAHQQELSKYSLEGWLGIGQCVNRFLEDDRSSVSSEAFESIGDVAEEDRDAAGQSWGREPAAGHVAAEDWGYGGSRLGNVREPSESSRPLVKHIVQQYEERTNAPTVGGFAAPRVQYDDAGRFRTEAASESEYEEEGQYGQAIEDPRVSEFMRAVLEAQKQVAEQYGQPVASTSGFGHVDHGRRSGFSSYWRSTDAVTPDFETLPTSNDLPKFGGITLHPEPQDPTPDREAIAGPPLQNQTPPSRRRDRDAYDPRKWALPQEQAIETRVLKRHPSEERLFGVEESGEYWPEAMYQEEQPDALSALSISQAITDLESATFADLVTDGRIASSQVAHWREEVAWLTSSGDDVMELVEIKTGKDEVLIQRPRPDVQTNLPALRSLDELLQRILLRMNAGAAASKRDLMGTREQTIQVLKAALMINEEVLQEMIVPQTYWDKLPQTIRQVLGVDVFTALTAKQVNPVHLLMVINPRTMQDAWRCVNNLEAAMLMWRALMADMAEPLAKKRATYAKRAAAMVHDLKMTWPSLQVTQLAELKITRNMDVGRAILESYSRALVSLCGKTISCLDYLLTLDVPSSSCPRPLADSGKRPPNTADPSMRPMLVSPSSKEKASNATSVGVSGKLTGKFMKLLGRRQSNHA